MLRRLDIRSVAIIESLTLDFAPGLSVITGETGAGKSILIGALNLVLGGRADRELVRAEAEAATVTAEFATPDSPELDALLSAAGVPRADEALLLRRVVTSEGRSRAYINDQAVSAATLQAVGARLVDISSQHQHQSLLKSENHLALIDQVGTPPELLKRAAAQHAELSTLGAERARLSASEQALREREDFLRFQLDELARADVKPHEEEDLKAEREWLAHAEKLRGVLGAAHELLAGDGAALSSLTRAGRELERAGAHWPEGAALAARLSGLAIETDDITAQLGAALRRVKADPRRLEQVEERLALLSRLLRKHGPTSVELFEKTAALRAELDKLTHLDESLAELDRRMAKSLEAADALARELSAVRAQSAARFSKDVERELAPLGMKGVRFDAQHTPRRAGEGTFPLPSGAAFGINGADEIEFLLAPNVGEPLKPLARIASGGELSRVMLAVKSVLLGADWVAVSVFDEVDSGIGGSVAQAVGAKIRALSDTRQVLCITHLPQIAACADRHLLVAKETRKGRTTTQVTTLATTEERVSELARMMAGAAAGQATLDAARELLSYATPNKGRAKPLKSA